VRHNGRNAPIAAIRYSRPFGQASTQSCPFEFRSTMTCRYSKPTTVPTTPEDRVSSGLTVSTLHCLCSRRVDHKGHRCTMTACQVKLFIRKFHPQTRPIGRGIVARDERLCSPVRARTRARGAVEHAVSRGDNSPPA